MQIRVARMGRFFSRGSETLIKLMTQNDWTLSDVVDAIGDVDGGRLAVSMINRYVHGHRRPSLLVGLAMERKLGLVAQTWAQSPSKGFKLKRTETAEDNAA